MSIPCRLLMMCVLGSCEWAHAAEPLMLYVSTEGRDEWSGRLAAPNEEGTDGPVATLHRARGLARDSRAQAEEARPVVVEVRGGTYYLDEPLVLGPEDSGTAEAPVTWRARAGEEVVLSGGRRLPGPWQSDDGVVHYTHLPEVQAGEWWFRQLRVGGERRLRARHPNLDPDEPYTSGWLHVAAAGTPGMHGPLGVDLGRGLGQLQERGTWLEYDITVPADGEYTLRVLYGNNGATNERFFGFTDMSGRTTVTVGEAEPLAVGDLPDTGSFYEGFRWARAGTIRLSAGRQGFRWTNTEGGALALLAFLLTTDDAYEPPAAPVGDDAPARPDGHTVVFHAADYDRKHGDLVGVHNYVDRRDPLMHTNFIARPGDLPRWEHTADAEIYVLPEWDWVSQIVHLVEVDHETNHVRIAGANATKPIFAANRYYVMNVPDALDEPGEWALVRESGRLYYRPAEEDFERQEVVAPVLDTLIELRGEPEAGRPVRHVHIEGFTITDTRFTAPEWVTDTYHPNDAAVRVSHAERCRIAGNVFRDVGGYGVVLLAGSRENAVVENEVVGAGQGGVYLDGYADGGRDRAPVAEALRPARNVVAGNHIHHCGLFYAHVSGVYVSYGVENLIAHNLVHHMPRYGISLKFNCPGNIIEYNEVRFTNLLTRDTGAIEMAGNFVGSVVRHNLVTDAIGSGSGNHSSPADAGGIYLDNMSSKCEVVGNIVTRCWNGVWVNWGGSNIIRNNIFAANRDTQVLVNLPRPGGTGAWRSYGMNHLSRNILWHTDPASSTYRVGSWREDAAEEARVEGNIVWAGGAAPVVRGTPGWEAWTRAGMDADAIVADPLLGAPAADDFALKPGSPALAGGFEAIDVDRIGLRGYRRGLADELPAP